MGRKEIADQQEPTRGHSGVSSRRATLLDEQNGGEPEAPKSNSLKDRFYGAVDKVNEFKDKFSELGGSFEGGASFGGGGGFQSQSQAESSQLGAELGGAMKAADALGQEICMPVGPEQREVCFGGDKGFDESFDELNADFDSGFDDDRDY